MNSGCPITRSDALARLAEFVPVAGADYARLRNRVSANADHRHVSRLSAALRRRLLGEREVVAAVLARHDYGDAEKFVSEVFWRTYWKGWLEHRPGLWRNVSAEAVRDRMQLAADPERRLVYEGALAGTTGIDAFDHWSGELANTGYLHNWARMQVASIWVFTLRLPWSLGAEWMFERLIDADPASNTLSWRWVAGLHTQGKAYLADSARISHMTGGRFAPVGLACSAEIPADCELPSRGLPREVHPPDPELPSLVLVTPEDLSLETELELRDVRAVVSLAPWSRKPVDAVAIDDALRRAGLYWSTTVEMLDDAAGLVPLARRLGCSQLVIPYVHAGPLDGLVASLRQQSAAAGMTLAEHRRDWDRLAWPHCGRGYFQLRTRIPELLRANGLVQEPGANGIAPGRDGAQGTLFPISPIGEEGSCQR